MSKTKKVLVCGATGFMGRNIVEYFEKQEGYEVYAVRYSRETISSRYR
jgi:nucleoside-diphosphate-sugar epimerase